MRVAPQMHQLDADKVSPKLYVGSAPAPGRYEDFQVIVLCSSEYQPPASDFPGAKVIHAPFDDTRRPTDADIEVAIATAMRVQHELKAGRRVLVTCYQGLNRSALVAGLVMKRHFKLTLTQIMMIMRTARGPTALHNSTFVSILDKF